MHVLHVYKTYFPDTYGGGPQVIFELCEGAAACGVEAEVFTLSRNVAPPRIRIGQHWVHRVKLNFEIASTGFSLPALRRFRELADAADVVHYHFPWPFMDMMHFYARHGKPSVVTYHSDIVAQKNLYALYRPVMFRFLDRVNSIVATSPKYVESSPVLRRYARKVSVIPIGITQLDIPPTIEARKQYWRERLGDRFFLFVGVFRYYKSLDILHEAVRNTDMVVALLGADPQNFRRGWPQTGSFRVLGALPDDDKVALLSLCTGLILPSAVRSEAFGISLLEGAMFGKPLISCEIGTGTSFVNISGQTGFVVPPNDSVALRDAMSRLLSRPAEAAEMGRMARQRYERLFTRERMVAQYLDLYRSIV